MENTYSKNRWGYVILGTIILLFAGLIYVWSLFRSPLSVQFPDWNASQLSLVFTISIICFCLGGFIAGRLSKKISPRLIIVFSAILMFVGFFVSSCIGEMDSASAIVVLTVFYGVFSGLGSGFSYNAVMSTVLSWFPDKAGIASGIMLFGFGAGSLVLGSVISYLIEICGIFTTLFWVSVAVAVVLIIGSLILKSNANAVRAQAATDGKKQYAIKDMIKTKTFWLFFFWVICGNAAGLLVINSAANIAEAFGIIAILGMLVSVMNGAGRIFYGFMFDKKGRKVSMTLNCFILIAASVLLFTGCISNISALILIGMLATGISYSCSPTASSALIHSYYGSKNYSNNFAFVNFSLIPAAILGPMIAGALQENANGAYDTTFIMMMVFAVICLVLNIILGVASRKEGFDN